jgi:hypothetical protein
MSDDAVATIRSVVKDIPAIDWTKGDDLTRYARAIVDGLPPFTHLMTPPPDTKLVLFSDELMQELAGQGRVEWGEPTNDGWYEPSVYMDPRLKRVALLELVWDWVAKSHATFPEHDHHCPCTDAKDKPADCTCGFAAAVIAIDALNLMEAP